MSWYGSTGLSLGGGMGGGTTDRFFNKPLEADSTQIGKFENLGKDVDQNPPSALTYACVRRRPRDAAVLRAPALTPRPRLPPAGASRRCPFSGRPRGSRW